MSWSEHRIKIRVVHNFSEMMCGAVWCVGVIYVCVCTGTRHSSTGSLRSEAVALAIQCRPVEQRAIHSFTFIFCCLHFPQKT